MTPSATSEELIKEHVVGRKLSGVTFVMDYVQLQFDPPPIVNALTPITVRCGSKIAATGAESFRNLLCEQIPKTVSSARLIEAEALTFTLEDGSTISLSLRPEDYVCPEAVNFYGANHLCIVI
jgi:hypothetical protein